MDEKNASFCDLLQSGEGVGAGGFGNHRRLFLICLNSNAESQARGRRHASHVGMRHTIPVIVGRRRSASGLPGFYMFVLALSAHYHMSGLIFVL